MEFACYRRTPASIQEEIIERYEKEREKASSKKSLLPPRLLGRVREGGLLGPVTLATIPLRSQWITVRTVSA
jgi:hypothetical protein